MLPVDLRAARKFTGHWPPHRPYTAASSVNCVGISRKLKSTCQDQNNASTSFLSIIYDNLCQYQPMMSPVAVDIDNSDFFPATGLRCHAVYCCYSALENEVSKIAQKTLMNAHFYRTVIVVTFIIKTRPYINISVEMLNQMSY